jgi:hypothetical protein
MVAQAVLEDRRLGLIVAAGRPALTAAKEVLVWMAPTDLLALVATF